MIILIPILILILSILFISGVLNLKIFNSTKKFLLHVKKPCISTHEEQISSPKRNPTTTNMSNKEDDLKQVFDTFDKNGDGFITREELKESLNNMGIIAPLQDVEEMVEKLDANKDGLVDIGEFRELYDMVRGKNGKNDSKVYDEEGKKDEDYDLKEAFNVFDENKDGLITVKELGLVLSSLGLKEGKIDEENCKEMIKKVDVDGDGMVNFDEFKMMMRANNSGLSSSNHLVTC